MGNCVRPVDPLIASIPKSTRIDASAVKQSRLPIIFIIGGPGAGKRTQTMQIAEHYGFLKIISCDLLRDEVVTRSQTGVIVAHLMSEGRLVPAIILLELIKTKMLNSLDLTQGFIISGFPREYEQCKLFDKQVRVPDLVLYLSVRNSLLMDRILARTVTSTERQCNFDSIRKRINDFGKKNKTILRYYKKQLITIDGEKDEASVFEDIRDAINNTLRNLVP